MKLNNMTVVAISFALFLASFLVMALMMDANIRLADAGRRDEMSLWPVVVGVFCVLCGLVSMAYAAKEYSQPSN